MPHGAGHERMTKPSARSSELVKRTAHLQSSSSPSRLAPAGSQPIHRTAPPSKNETIVNPVKGDYVFLQGDTSSGGAGSTLTVGPNWWSAKVVTSHSKKFTSAQSNYAVHEQEIQAVMEGFEKNEGQLIDREVIVLTDNRSLENFLTGKALTPRQARVYDYLSRFKFVIKYIEGKHNHVPYRTCCLANLKTCPMTSRLCRPSR